MTAARQMSTVRCRRAQQNQPSANNNVQCAVQCDPQENKNLMYNLCGHDNEREIVIK
jgi:hypothetical protein